MIEKLKDFQNFQTPIEKIVEEMRNDNKNKEFLEELLKEELDKCK